MKQTFAGPSPGIICFSNLDWGYLRYRKQHLMSRLAEHYRVIYVNPPRAMKWKQTPFRRRLTAVTNNLRVYEPLVLPGIRNSARLKSLNYKLIACALERSRKGFARAAVWIYSPHALPIAHLLSPEFMIYDIADNYAVPSGPVLRDDAERREIELLANLERRVLSEANVVFCVSEPLVESARALNRSVHLVPNGCDFEHYAMSPPPKADNQRRPRIGYVGTIAPRFDMELVVETARTHPEWDFEMIGPISPLVVLPNGSGPENLHWRGEIPYGQVPDMIKSFNVCVLPLREIPFAYCSSPIQVWDYLAAGRPVVSTPVAQLERVPDLIATARGPVQFAAAIAHALASDEPDRFEARRRFASGNTWDSRVENILAVLREAGFKSAEQT